jgi:hypothetical protein
MRRIRQHLTYANVMATIAVFIAISGGTAVALNGTDTVQSDDLGPGAQVKAPDVADNAVNSADVVNESLTGADIKNQSGVQTCVRPLTARYGPLCVGSDGGQRTWAGAMDYCTDFGLRLPTASEAGALAKKYDVPGNGSGFGYFWTDSYYNSPEGSPRALIIDEFGDVLQDDRTNTEYTACVTDPSA